MVPMMYFQGQDNQNNFMLQDTKNNQQFDNNERMCNYIQQDPNFAPNEQCNIEDNKTNIPSSINTFNQLNFIQESSQNPVQFVNNSGQYFFNQNHQSFQTNPNNIIQQTIDTQKQKNQVQNKLKQDNQIDQNSYHDKLYNEQNYNELTKYNLIQDHASSLQRTDEEISRQRYMHQNNHQKLQKEENSQSFFNNNNNNKIFFPNFTNFEKISEDGMRIKHNEDFQQKQEFMQSATIQKFQQEDEQDYNRKLIKIQYKIEDNHPILSENFNYQQKKKNFQNHCNQNQQIVSQTNISNQIEYGLSLTQEKQINDILHESNIKNQTQMKNSRICLYNPTFSPENILIQKQEECNDKMEKELQSLSYQQIKDNIKKQKLTQDEQDEMLCNKEYAAQKVDGFNASTNLLDLQKGNILLDRNQAYTIDQQGYLQFYAFQNEINISQENKKNILQETHKQPYSTQISCNKSSTVDNNQINSIEQNKFNYCKDKDIFNQRLQNNDIAFQQLQVKIDEQDPSLEDQIQNYIQDRQIVQSSDEKDAYHLYHQAKVQVLQKFENLDQKEEEEINFQNLQSQIKEDFYKIEFSKNEKRSENNILIGEECINEKLQIQKGQLNEKSKKFICNSNLNQKIKKTFQNNQISQHNNIQKNKLEFDEKTIEEKNQQKSINNDIDVFNISLQINNYQQQLTLINTIEKNSNQFDNNLTEYHSDQQECRQINKKEKKVQQNISLNQSDSKNQSYNYFRNISQQSYVSSSNVQNQNSNQIIKEEYNQLSIPIENPKSQSISYNNQLINNNQNEMNKSQKQNGQQKVNSLTNHNLDLTEEQDKQNIPITKEILKKQKKTKPIKQIESDIEIDIEYSENDEDNNKQITENELNKNKKVKKQRNKKVKLDQKEGEGQEQDIKNEDNDKVNSDDENQQKLNRLNKVAIGNASKNILKAFQKYIQSKQVEVSTVISLNRLYQRNKMSNLLLIKIYLNPRYNKLMHEFITQSAEEWMIRSKIQDLNTHLIILNELKNDSLEILRTTKKKHQRQKIIEFNKNNVIKNKNKKNNQKAQI